MIIMKSQLHPGARWLFRFKGYSSFIFVFILAFMFSGFYVSEISKSNSAIPDFFNMIVIIVVSAVLLVLIIGEIYSRMAYTRWFYEFADNQLRLERGIIWKKYSNIPYERVQNVDITRGIMARICGFSTVNIQTAGFSYTPNKAVHAEGYIPAVPIEEAEKIREFLMKKISKNSKQGL
jgi:membrane protein YdbS with pleckstrin-like domain